MKFANLAGGSYESQSHQADGERTVNLIPEVVEAPGGQAKLVLYPSPGVTTFATTALTTTFIPVSVAIDGPCRGAISVNQAAFATLTNAAFTVGGGNVYLTLSTGTVYLLNCSAAAILPIAQDASPATMSIMFNGGVGYLYVTSGGFGYVYTFTNPSFPSGGWTAGTVGPTNVICGGFLDGFFLALDTSSTLHISDALDPLTWDPTQIVVRSTSGDPWVSMLVANQQIYLFGAQSTDIWSDTGASPFPFAPIPGATVQIGILAPFSAAELNNAPIWLGRSAQGAGIVYQMQGQSPVRVSTFAVEYAIQHYTTRTDAIGWAYEQDGHHFYVLEFPTEQHTWVYDASTGLWHERGQWDTHLSSGSYQAWRSRFHCFAHDRHFVGDRQTGTLYTLSTQVYTDVNGDGIRRLRRPPIMADDQMRIWLDDFQVYGDVGVGLTSGQGVDPQLMTRWSKDGGQTWSNERWMGLGAKGQYNTRPMLTRLGASRNRQVELTVSDPVPVRLVEAYISASKGRT